MEKARDLEEAVIFIDEFEEIAGSRDNADRIDKSITNELLKQVALFKNGANKALLVCATNYIRDLDPALLRPGRFDCIIPVGGMREDERKTVLQYYLSRVNLGDVDVDQINLQIARFTPADIQYLFERVAQFAFEQELANKQEYFVTTETVMRTLTEIRPTLTDEVINEFDKDSQTYSRS
jgi:transitional endoplasmic reticulum ATPase